VLLMAAQPYAGELAASRIEHCSDRPRAGEVVVAALFGLLPLFLLPPGQAVLALVLGVAVSALACWRLCRPLGGYTGDVLGAGVATFQTAFLLGVAADLGRWT
jgi:adenosylcobinamide-GDP ribazoletransferase